MKIGIVNYGMGNIQSIIGAIEYIGNYKTVYTNDNDQLLSCDKLILPGVGAFDKAMNNIKTYNLDHTINEFVKTKPILGICLGMQIMSSIGYENGTTQGLNLVEGETVKLNLSKSKIPHIGFNQVRFQKNSRLFNEVPNYSDFYFTHSFHFVSNENLDLSYCDYEGEFVCGFEKKNISGVQFHPELSQKYGLRLLKNFIDIF